jgi:hypothetical protein
MTTLPSISNPTSKWSYGDEVVLANLLELMNKDVVQTNTSYKKGKGDEQNPLAKPFYTGTSPDIVQLLALLGQGYLTNRWDKDVSPEQRRAEMAGLTLAEIWGLQTSKQPWTVRYGYSF